MEREVEDIDALIQAAGGSAHLVGLSSGAAIVLEAAASGLAVRKVAAYEPPYMADDDGRHAHHEGRLRALIAVGRRADAVKYFMRDMVGIPAILVFLMRLRSRAENSTSADVREASCSISREICGKRDMQGAAPRPV